MDDRDIPPEIRIAQCEVRCGNCSSNWRSSLDGGIFSCPVCGADIDPRKAVVVEKEEEIN